MNNASPSPPFIAIASVCRHRHRLDRIMRSLFGAGAASPDRRRASPTKNPAMRRTKKDRPRRKPNINQPHTVMFGVYDPMLLNADNLGNGQLWAPPFAGAPAGGGGG